MEKMFFHPQAKPEKKSEHLTESFREMSRNSLEKEGVFEELENNLEAAGFSLAQVNEVASIFHDPRLFCRSEALERVMRMLLDGEEIEVANPDNHANMCRVAGGKGFRTAMLEGFSTQEVNGVVKVVITFSGDHLFSKENIENDSSLWETKKETALVSLKGKGEITSEDIRMVSFRFPIKFFPEKLLTEDERDRLEDDGIAFVVRHYTRSFR